MTTQPAPHPLPAATTVGRVHLTVSDLERSLDFYRGVLGFQLIDRSEGVARLGAGGSELLRLTGNPKARPAPGHTGLYHFAVLMPSRARLGASLQRLVETGYSIQGAADHLVSEAIYLADPDGSGIELYRDRPREQWPTQNGQLQMDNAPLDFQGILAEHLIEPHPWEGLHPETVIGHMHLHVADIPAAERFYNQQLGLDRMMSWHSASFLSAGGYHHHLGVNTWGTAGAPPPPPDSTGLREFSLVLPSAADLDAVVAQLEAQAVEVAAGSEGRLVRDPSHNALLLTAG